MFRNVLKGTVDGETDSNRPVVHSFTICLFLKQQYPMEKANNSLSCTYISEV